MCPEENPISGKLITFEGIDGAGKTSVVRQLPCLLARRRVPVLVCGERGSPFSKLLMNQKLRSMSSFLKTYLFAADRAWTYEKIGLPALRSGSLVLWDRYVDSALAYRAAEFSLREESVDIRFVRHINSPFRPPDLTFYICITPQTSIRRTNRDEGQGRNRIAFLKKVERQYARLARQRRYVMIDGERALKVVTHEIVLEIKARFPDFFSR
jgi:dTMP kinase